MRRPSIREVFVTTCGLSLVVSFGAMGWVVMGQDNPISGPKRLQQAGGGEVQGVESKQPECLQQVSDLKLGSVAQADDPRLQGVGLIVVRKAERSIQRFRAGTALMLEEDTPACWHIGLGPAPEGHKYRQGDGRTPEGWYRTSDKPWSQWYGAIAIHYPNARDAEAGRVQGRIDKPTERRIQAALAKDKKPPQASALGGEILIHGQGGFSDWTLGCVAMENQDLDKLRASLPKGLRTDVLVLP